MKYPCDVALPPLRTRPGRQPREPRRYYPATAIPLPGYAARLAQGSPRPRDLYLSRYRLRLLERVIQQASQSGLAAGCCRVSGNNLIAEQLEIRA